MIWFFLLIFAAYVTGGGIYTGDIVGSISILTILVVNSIYGLNLSSVGVTTAVLAMIMATLFFRSYTKKIMDFEKDLIEQKQLMITQSRFAAMGEMISMIAHQWRQPLSTTTLLITQERVKLMMDEKQNNPSIEILDKISDTMVYLSDTIDDFQTFFKPGKSKEKIAVDELIGRIQNFVQARLSTSGVALNIEKCEEAEVETYVNRLVQSIINIINNAVDALLENNISNPRISISFEASHDHLSIFIEDNAGGIDAEIVEKIYEPYFSTKSKNGTGLGLYMSKMIIEQHIKGSLSVENTTNGARFKIVLPRVSKTI
jgi:C4-dicarboxylate-specific signal transduction histidine kinase